MPAENMIVGIYLLSMDRHSVTLAQELAVFYTPSNASSFV